VSPSERSPDLSAITGLSREYDGSRAAGSICRGPRRPRADMRRTTWIRGGRRFIMTAPESCDPPALLTRISTETVQAMKQHYGKGPVSAKSYLLDDLLFVVLREGITQAERTMLDAGHQNSVRRFRQGLENEMAQSLIEMIERLTGRRVINYQSQLLFDPDMSIKIFVFDPHGAR
jgi:uncharacterized protein YbcI